jgi:hypothetical protein
MLIKLATVAVMVMALSGAIVFVDPLMVIGTSLVINLVVVNVVGTVTFAEADTMMIVSSAVMGTASVWIILASWDDVTLSNGAVVFDGFKFEKKILGILVGEGWAGGFPAVSRVVCNVYKRVNVSKLLIVLGV